MRLEDNLHLVVLINHYDNYIGFYDINKLANSVYSAVALTNKTGPAGIWNNHKAYYFEGRSLSKESWKNAVRR